MTLFRDALLLCGALCLGASVDGEAELARLRAQLSAAQAAIQRLTAGRLTAGPPTPLAAAPRNCDSFRGAHLDPVSQYSCECDASHFCSSQSQCEGPMGAARGALLPTKFPPSCQPCGPDDDALSDAGQRCCACVRYTTLGASATRDAAADGAHDTATSVLLDLNLNTTAGGGVPTAEPHGLLVGVWVGVNNTRSGVVAANEVWRLQVVRPQGVQYDDGYGVPVSRGGGGVRGGAGGAPAAAAAVAGGAPTCEGKQFVVQQELTVAPHNQTNHATSRPVTSAVWLSAVAVSEVPGLPAKQQPKPPVPMILGAGTRVSAIAPHDHVFAYYHEPCGGSTRFYMAAGGSGEGGGLGAAAAPAPGGAECLVPSDSDSRPTPAPPTPAPSPLAQLVPGGSSGGGAALCTMFDFRVLVHSCEEGKTGPTCETTCGGGQVPDARHMVCIDPPPSVGDDDDDRGGGGRPGGGHRGGVIAGVSIALVLGGALLGYWWRRRQRIAKGGAGARVGAGHRRDDSAVKERALHQGLLASQQGGEVGGPDQEAVQRVDSFGNIILGAHPDSLASSPANRAADWGGGRARFQTAPAGGGGGGGAGAGSAGLAVVDDDGYGDATGRWKLEVKAPPYQPLTNYLADFEFGDGPLGISFLKHHDGVFRVGSVLDTCHGRHVSRTHAKLALETVDASAPAPPRVGTLTPCVGDRIVAVAGALVDDLMTQRLLGSMIRQARRPVVLTFEPRSLGRAQSDGESLIEGVVVDGVLLSNSDKQELADARALGACGARLALTPPEMQQRKAELKEHRERLSARRVNMHACRQRDDRTLQDRARAHMQAFEDEYRAKREKVKAERDALLEEGERKLDRKYEALESEVRALQLKVTNLESEVDPFYSDGTAASSAQPMIPAEDPRAGDGGSSEEAPQTKKRWFGRHRRGGGSRGSGGDASMDASADRSGTTPPNKRKLWGRQNRQSKDGSDSDRRSKDGSESDGSTPSSSLVSTTAAEAPRVMMLRSGEVSKYTVGQRLQSRQGQAGEGAQVGVVTSMVADDGSVPPRGAGVVHLEFESSEVNPDAPPSPASSRDAPSGGHSSAAPPLPARGHSRSSDGRGAFHSS